MVYAQAHRPMNATRFGRRQRAHIGALFPKRTDQMRCIGSSIVGISVANLTKLRNITKLATITLSNPHVQSFDQKRWKVVKFVPDVLVDSYQPIRALDVLENHVEIDIKHDVLCNVQPSTLHHIVQIARVVRVAA
ncbi:MAG: hypothetical protein EB075_11310 [Bacteroidetes bacterium]|nr:hypothetical protein [Bacteroidota bacterium]